MVLTQVRLQAAVLGHDGRQTLARHKLDHACRRRRCQHRVRADTQVEVLLAQQAVHQREELDHELILPQVVAVLEDDWELAGGLRIDGLIVAVLFALLEVEQQWEEIRLEDRGLVRYDAFDLDPRVQGQRQSLLRRAEAMLGIGEVRPQLVDTVRAEVFRSPDVLGTQRQCLDELVLVLQHRSLGRPFWSLLQLAVEVESHFRVKLADGRLRVALDRQIPVEGRAEDGIGHRSVDEELRKPTSSALRRRLIPAAMASRRGVRLMFKLERLHQLQQVQEDFLNVSC